MALTERYSLVIPLLASFLVHGLVVAVGEMAGVGESPQPPARPLKAEYQPPPPSREAAPPPPSEVKKEPEPGGNTVSLETSDPRYKPYFTVLRKGIAKRWKEPAVSPSDPKKGSLLMEFTLERDGGLRVASVVRSSGVRSFDFAAVEAVKKAAPFDPFPKEIKEKELSIRALFVYE